MRRQHGVFVECKLVENEDKYKRALKWAAKHFKSV